MDKPVCYCFGYSAEDIKKDFQVHGKSLIMENIIKEKKIGGCDCAGKNPAKR